MNPTPLAPAPYSADVGIVAAMTMEIGPFLDRLKKVRKYHARQTTIHEGELDGRIVAVVFTGMGRKRAQRGAELLLAGHRPRVVISPGYAGALAPDLRRNDIVIPHEVMNIEGNLFPIPDVLPLPPEARRGRLLTGDAVVRTAAEKAALRERFGADLVDMETSALAAYCGERGTRFVSIRVVSDESGIDLPPEILTIMGESGGVRLGATIGALWKRPSVVGDLLKMREHALEAADKLSAVLGRTIAQIIT